MKFCDINNASSTCLVSSKSTFQVIGMMQFKSLHHTSDDPNAAERNLTFVASLGFVNDEPKPIETSLQEFLGTFDGLLPMEVSTPRNEMLNLGDVEAEALKFDDACPNRHERASMI